MNDREDSESITNLRSASDLKAEYFVTSNELILHNRKSLEEYFKIKIRSPQEM
jgi:hypothetical protein